MRTLRTLLAVSLACSLAGCMSKARGARLGHDLEAQATRITALETQVTELSAREQTHHDETTATLTDLRTRLDEVRASLEASGRGSADLGADLQSLRDLAQRLDGRLAEIDQNIAATTAQVREQDAQLDQQIRLLAQRAGIDVTLRDADIPTDRTEHFAAGYRAYQQNDYVRARALLGEYIRRYPQDDNADNAQYWVAKSYQDQQQWQRAIGAYRELARMYSTSDVLDQALFAMSQCFYSLHDCANARTALEALKQTRPQSTLIRDVDRRIRELRNPPRGYCTSG